VDIAGDENHQEIFSMLRVATTAIPVPQTLG
jgi:hypothetical protein